ncbi:MAG: TonB-dependent receptor [Cytophagia bacterium]|nr:MAG: TonB-dependent receptor [Cytophagia bacterium]
MKNQLLFLGLLLNTILLSSLSFAQTGSLKGSIVDINNKESLVGATIMIENTSIATSSDIDGNFILSNIKAGQYNVVINYISYKTKIIENVKIYGGTTTEINIEIEEDANVLGEATVVAQRETFTELSVVSEIKTAQNVAVGISGEQIAKSQDRDAAQAVRRIPGVSLIDNRFVMVRGLGQRYNTVLLNDIITPSSEVDARAFSFDIVPTNIIDRMMVYKSGAGDIPGDFAGGVVKIYTKNAPDQNFINFGATIGYRANTTFQNVTKYEGGSLDFLGFDNGGRSAPSNLPARVSSDLSNEQRASIMNTFKGNWNMANQTVLPDMRLNFSLGRRMKLGGINVGTLTSINYGNTQQYAEVTLNQYVQNSNDNEKFTQLDLSADDKQITNNVRLGILHNWSFKFNNNHTIEFKNLFNQLSFTETVIRDQKDIPNAIDFRNYSLRFESRSIYSGQLVGRHTFLKDKLNVGWQLGYAYTNKQEPDWRRVRTNRPSGTDEPFKVSIAPSPNVIDAGRFFSNLKESILTFASNTEWTLGNNKEKTKAIKVRAGFYLERRDRNFQARFFGYKGIGNINNIVGLPLNQAFDAQNITGSQNSLTMEEGTRPQDRYTANSTLAAGYIGASIPITKRLTTAIAFRTEYNIQQVSGRKLNGDRIEVNNPILSPLPSFNITYEMNDKSLVRAAYSMTVNRPEFRELVPFDFFDFNFNSFVIGNPELKTATIQNADLRWEYYPSVGELISVGVFYKHFTNPIETFLMLSNGGPNNLGYSFINAKTATNYGVEFEFRKSFAGLLDGKFFDNLSFSANASFIKSTVDLGDVVRSPQSDGSVSTLNVKDSQDKERPMVYQSPYLINAGFYYTDETSGWQASLLYNVFGRRIFAVGSINNPTMYEIPRNIIDLSIAKRVNKKVELRFGVQDLLNQAFLIKQDSNIDGAINGQDKTIRSFRRGQYMTFGFNYNF